LALPHAFYIVFFFLLGSCVGSFLNVVVWRLPQVEEVEGEGLFRGFYRGWRALSTPPSHCPKCGSTLKWYDNVPVIGWIKLKGKCRFCKAPISARYPIIEAITGLLFVLYYVAFFMIGIGPCMEHMTPDGFAQYFTPPMSINEHWPVYAIDVILISALLAASLIDAELFIIPLGIPWFVIPLGLIEHAIWDRSGWPGALNPSPAEAALAAGAGLGTVISFLLLWRGILPLSFAQGEPMLEVDRAKLASGQEQPPEFTPAQVRAEMRKEMLFLLPPLILGLAAALTVWEVPAAGRAWASVVSTGWASGLLGSVLGLLVGGFVVWFTRIAGSYAFGREAMGMGDVHLMAAVGAVLGPGSAVVAFFLAPFFGMGIALYLLLLGKRREVPYGPYLSLATAFVMLFYCPIANYLSPGVTGLAEMLSQLLHGR
jgi:leader peptidase (prepilin peptidase) / N-methyltransferase